MHHFDAEAGAFPFRKKKDIRARYGMYEEMEGRGGMCESNSFSIASGE
jgi:hypothetical protein